MGTGHGVFVQEVIPGSNAALNGEAFACGLFIFPSVPYQQGALNLLADVQVFKWETKSSVHLQVWGTILAQR